MRITNLRRIDDRTVECCYQDDSDRHKVKVKLLVDGDIKGLQLIGLSSEVRRRLHNSPEGLDFSQQLWKFFAGEQLALPIELKCLTKPDPCAAIRE